MLDENIPTLPSAVYIRERLDYDPNTGDFVWRYCEAMPACWNAKWAGKVAGVIMEIGYRAICINYKMHYAHRLAWLIVTDAWPADQIDHVNGNRADNRIANLRAVSRTENMRNSAMRSDNTSGAMGVWWRKDCGKWAAEIMVDGRKISLGLFTHLADAIAARLAAEVKYGFHPNHGRR